MIKLIIFDLDGVLASTKEIHFFSLNEAISEVGSKYSIAKDEHFKIYGLPKVKISGICSDFIAKFKI